MGGGIRPFEFSRELEVQISRLKYPSYEKKITIKTPSKYADNVETSLTSYRLEKEN